MVECEKCEKEIDTEEDDHAICDVCNAILCCDTSDCIRDHFEYAHEMGYTLEYPKAARRLEKERLAKLNDQ